MSEMNDSFPQPILFEQSRLGGFMDTRSADLPRNNSDGKSVVPLSADQRYLFDTQGWLLFPAVLDEDQVVEMRKFCDRLHRDPESLPAHQRTPIAGPLEQLTDHPVVVGCENVNPFLWKTQRHP